jgi:16S rRNA (cytidine1402-2'-O)-methyltransferase
MAKGTLYIISTPIGNMSDMTLRAIDTLKQVSLILSEDTRETSKILLKYNISKPQISYRDQNHAKVIGRILDVLESGENVALVSNSGTPLISDPGFKLVRDVIKKEIEVVSIPGPSAVISALVVSGLPTDKFSFIGFLPKSGGQREKILKMYGGLDSTLIIYESPNRLISLMTKIQEVLGNRKVCVAGELTKVYEKIVRGRVIDVVKIIEKTPARGEYVVLVAKEGF